MTATISPRDNAQRAYRSRLLFKLIIAFGAASLAANILFMSLPADYPVEEPYGFGQLVILLQAGVTLLQIPVHILAIVFFLQWFRRAYYNLWKIGRRPDHTDGWAVGSWFIPVLNLFRPYSIMKEIWYDTGATTSAATDSRTVLRWWWVAYLVHVFGNSMANTAMKKAETMPQLLGAMPFSVFSDVADIASAALSILVIGYVHQAEQHWQGRAQLQSLGGPAPEPISLLPTEEEHYG
ncbi:DUF4328 domain-containing protein [Hymenobacter lapidiphilus]|uniref:DUF4328 domain-containing protein n=1 Tax=Hymenobacter sp. CCM 8763 TaxID=2303334 RepID=UPI000E3553C1|nr:DUF4328 domain-containing protein [Hymenobacter sp. CCM 8763]RFP63762.1 DUF4328 domain-containing protein [Hymenobacter sp. CCM 8763]